ncbi:GalNAc(5)-diNAcBac-PP-undecaprenol beta-1,3-glucosyltransferase [Photobacterium malacitanum]|uniref:GalNAc(5)-diNAcBac-PP-undecaprenol beta-1,3-glucosyltransferase n=1 Tax=Photobacterium malacitanum TaxID=2204294 RepID=A0A1Y6MIH7_9GAMM|nr:glycosyltransferase family 2 protein [Photobacterium malacitanum]SMY35598.1 GalNAc(5)-diNAcBac-PP-undecaprenol beta-1,3-glucosyltransferase [Photobacterium malacitanum]
MLISVVTPTYNRAHLLERLIKSLKNQTQFNFEWIVIDDGSVDNTKEVISELTTESKFTIKYVYQENQGKHVALNVGFSEAKGDYLIILDSDDILANNAIEIIERQFNLAKDIDIISFCNKTLDNKDVGNMLHGFICSQLEYSYKYKGTGDRTEVFSKKVYDNYRFPVFSGEKFCPEALVWNRMALKHKTKYVKDVIYFCEYQVDGLSSKIIEIRAKSPNATLLYYRELLNNPIPKLEKIKACINYWRFVCHSNKPLVKKTLGEITFYDFISVPFGVLYFLKDKYL